MGSVEQSSDNGFSRIQEDSILGLITGYETSKVSMAATIGISVHNIND